MHCVQYSSAAFLGTYIPPSQLTLASLEELAPPESFEAAIANTELLGPGLAGVQGCHVGKTRVHGVPSKRFSSSWNAALLAQQLRYSCSARCVASCRCHRLTGLVCVAVMLPCSCLGGCRQGPEEGPAAGSWRME